MLICLSSLVKREDLVDDRCNLVYRYKAAKIFELCYTTTKYAPKYYALVKTASMTESYDDNASTAGLTLLRTARPN